jgi:MFS family permease
MLNLQTRKWVIVGALFVILTVLFGGLLNFGVFFEPLRRHFFWTHAQTSSLITVLLLTMMVASPMVGLLLERIEAQSSIAIGATIAIAAYAIASLANSYHVLLVAYGLLGLGLAMSTLVPAQVVIANWFEERLRGTAFGVAAAGSAFGGVTMVLTADAEMGRWGWRDTYLASTVPIVMIVIPIVVLIVRSRPAVDVADLHHDQQLPGLEIGEGLRTRAFWMIIAAYLCWGFAIGVPIAHLIPYLMRIGYTAHSAAMVMVWYEAAGTIGGLLMGVFGDRLGGRFVLAACFAMITASFWALLGAYSAGMEILFIFLFGFGVAAPAGLLAMLLAQTLGLRSFGFFSGAGQFVLFLGLAVAPFVGGWIVDVTNGVYRDAFELCALVALCGAGVSLAIAVPRRRATSKITQPQSAGAAL